MTAAASTVALVRRPETCGAHFIIARHSKSFALASKLLPPRLRDDVAVVYAWCRRVDDSVDCAADVEPAVLLARLGDELVAAYEDVAQDPLIAAFGSVARQHAIPRTYPNALLAGMAMDLAGTRYVSHDDLFAYAYRVAGAVGLMMAHVFGIDDDDALVAAAHLGIAMQITNICRDVVEDWGRGRLYIPDEMLAVHGAGGLADELGRPFPTKAAAPIGAAVCDLLAMADRYYSSADRGLVALPWRAAFAVRCARDLYAAIGERIARADHDVTAGRAVVSNASKIARVMLAALRTATAVPERLARRGRGPYRVPSRVLELRDVPRL